MSRPRWEYKRMVFPTDDTPEQATKRLNAEGSDGWEVVAMGPAAPAVWCTVWFKRLVIDE